MAQHIFTGVDPFLWHLAVNGMARGYWFYVAGWIPSHKDPLRIDAKLLTRYQITASKWTRHRKKQRGEANVRYQRIGQFFVLLATEGIHSFYTLETPLDFRRTPLRFHGMRIGGWRDQRGVWHPSVRLGPGRLKKLEERLGASPADQHGSILNRVPGRRFQPVQWQLRGLVRNFAPTPGQGRFHS